jgi:putative colanic acid biosynthesis acetyltransferase WcaF
MKSVKIENVDPWPYSFKDYVKRVIWQSLYCSIWKLCWKRIPVLRASILRALGARVERDFQVDGSARIMFPWLLRCGRRSAIGPRVDIYNLGGIDMGDDVVLSQDVYLCGGTHDYTRNDYPLLRKKITIGNGVWVCAGAFIGPGVTVGEGAIVGARAVVMKDVEPWTVVAGNPAVAVKRRVMQNLA